MSSPADRFAGVELLLVDGNNLLHRLAGGPEPTAVRLLLARLRAVVPASSSAIVMLDGAPDPGAPMRRRIDAHLEVRHSGGRLDADDRLVAIVADWPLTNRAAITVVTDDRALADRIRRLGGRPRRLEWLTMVLERPTAGGPGHAPGRGFGGPAAGRRAAREIGPDRPAEEAAEDSGDDVEAAARPPWTPGRGATRKRGNPHRARRRAADSP